MTANSTAPEAIPALPVPHVIKKIYGPSSAHILLVNGTYVYLFGAVRLPTVPNEAYIEHVTKSKILFIDGPIFNIDSFTSETTTIVGKTHMLRRGNDPGYHGMRFPTYSNDLHVELFDKTLFHGATIGGIIEHGSEELQCKALHRALMFIGSLVDMIFARADGEDIETPTIDNPKDRARFDKHHAMIQSMPPELMIYFLLMIHRCAELSSMITIVERGQLYKAIKEALHDHIDLWFIEGEEFILNNVSNVMFNFVCLFTILIATPDRTCGEAYLTMLVGLGSTELITAIIRILGVVPIVFEHVPVTSNDSDSDDNECYEPTEIMLPTLV